MALVEKRYAEALVNIAVDQNAIQAFQEDLEAVASAYSGMADFREFLLSPEVKAGSKQEALRQIFTDRVKQEVLHLALLLVEKGRIMNLPEIYREFVELADQKRNILHLVILSPFPLDEQQVGRITGKFGALYGAASVKADVKVDKSLIGGVKVIIGDKVIDGTTAGRLKALKNILAGMV